MRRDLELEVTIVEKYVAMEARLDERARRLWAAAEFRAIGYGGEDALSLHPDLFRGEWNYELHPR